VREEGVGEEEKEEQKEEEGEDKISQKLEAARHLPPQMLLPKARLGPVQTPEVGN
jgi:hypothetical protein